MNMENLSLSELRSRLTALGISTETPGLNGKDRWNELMQRLVNAICGENQEEIDNEEVEKDLEPIMMPLQEKRIEPSRGRKAPPAEDPPPEPKPKSPKQENVFEDKWGSEEFERISLSDINQVKNLLKKITNKRSLAIANRLSGKNQDPLLKELGNYLRKLEFDLEFCKEMQRKSEKKIQREDIKTNLDHFNLPKSSSLNLIDVLSSLELDKAETKERISNRRSKIREDEEDNAEYGIDVENELQSILSHASLTNSKMSRTKKKFNEMQNLDKSLSESTSTPMIKAVLNSQSQPNISVQTEDRNKHSSSDPQMDKLKGPSSTFDFNISSSVLGKKLDLTSGGKSTISNQNQSENKETLTNKTFVLSSSALGKEIDLSRIKLSPHETPVKKEISLNSNTQPVFELDSSLFGIKLQSLEAINAISRDQKNIFSSENELKSNKTSTIGTKNFQESNEIEIGKTQLGDLDSKSSRSENSESDDDQDSSDDSSSQTNHRKENQSNINQKIVLTTNSTNSNIQFKEDDVNIQNTSQKPLISSENRSVIDKSDIHNQPTEVILPQLQLVILDNQNQETSTALEIHPQELKDQIKKLRQEAKAFEKQNDISSAETKYEEALGEDPLDIVTLQEFAIFLHKKKGELLRAEAFFNRALQLCLPNIHSLLVQHTPRRSTKDSQFHSSPDNQTQKLSPLFYRQVSQTLDSHSPKPSDNTTNKEKVNSSKSIYRLEHLDERYKLKSINTLLLSYSNFMIKSKGDIEVAAILLQKTVKLAPKDAYSLATYAHFMSQYYQDSNDSSKPTTAEDMKNSTPKKSSTSSSLSGEIDEMFRSALKQDPQNLIYMMWYAKFLKNVNKLGPAELFYNSAYNLSAHAKDYTGLEATAICNYASFLYKKKKNVKKAEELFIEGVKKYPNHSGLKKNYNQFKKILLKKQQRILKGNEQHPEERTHKFSSSRENQSDTNMEIEKEEIDEDDEDDEDYGEDDDQYNHYHSK